MKILKSIILVIMIVICVFLSSRVWLVLPDLNIFHSDEEPKTNETTSNISIWKVVKPNKYYYNQGDIHYAYNNPNDYKLWDMAQENLNTALKEFKKSKTNLVVGEYFPEDSIIMEFDNKMPIELFLQKYKLDKKNIKTKLNYIEKIAVGLDENNTIYIFNGDSTVVVNNSDIDNSKFITTATLYIKEIHADCKQGTDVSGVNIKNTIPNIASALNPVFVKSEIDINNSGLIEQIAKDYYGKDFIYVRKSKEIEGNILFIYKNEKVLKISSEGLLDFFDAKMGENTETNMYQSLLTAMKFTSKFLQLPDDVYLSSIETVQQNGKFGYKFIFNYRIMDNPIIFSQIRDSKPLEVIVVGNKVISYKRFIRNIDETQKDKMIQEKILSVDEVLASNLKTNSSSIEGELKVLTHDMLGKIDNVYLAYYDRARKLGGQQLILVWVVEIEGKSHIFNAITGALLETI